ncbi:MAG: GH3 auxin-responsive promoter family protein [Pseudoflavonifractor sp.]|nr:GH3 auxin-responsive promoter family protein [Alloprevotella sp.]MCM1116912.1 GH3 auxin-responsive promoter family protein [Pseudoflavonifractor sp.]
MIDFTPIVRPIFSRRVEAARRWSATPEATQRRVLATLLRRGAATRWGAAHGFGAIRSYEEYRDREPVTPYEELRPWVMKMIGGERSVLWPGRCRWYAQSSGTSDGRSKYIPITDASLRESHYGGGSEAVAHYLAANPSSRLFSGKNFILGGSFASTLEEVPKGVCVGDLSATLIRRINPLANMVRVPSRQVALMANWEEKLPALVEASLHENITGISGVPSWFMTVIRRVMERAGAETIHDVWPNLEVFFHGGIAFGPYRDQYKALTDPDKMMHYVDTYNASEGFFAVQNELDDNSMLLLLNHGTFYEFRPAGNPTAMPVAAWEVKEGEVYELIITSANGLWRYPIGDTVKIESTTPLKITIAGRTKAYINAFGEELMVHNADRALERVCRQMGCTVANYTAGPVYAEGGRSGRHHWVIEFSLPPASLQAFAEALDKALTDENSDYAAKRSGNIFLAPLSVASAPAGLFDRWLALGGGRLGGQRKIPRLSPTPALLRSLAELEPTVAPK